LVLALAFTSPCSRRTTPLPEAGATTPPAPIAPLAASSSAAAQHAPADAGAPNAPAKDLNVLLITVDSLRADMPWTGYPRPIAPGLPACGETAVVYDRFYSISSYTAMSVGGMLAGRYPSELERSGAYFAKWPD